MNWFEAVVLGVVQGLTEFLPVSSSGHLVLFQHLFGMEEPELLFDVCVHVGTLVAVVVVFYRELISLLITVGRLPALLSTSGGIGPLFKTNAEFRLIIMIIAGSVPTALLGLVFARMAEQLFGTLWLVGVTLGITGTVLWFTRHKIGTGRRIGAMRFGDALTIGLVQGLAIVPGISRSGSTIATALYLGVDRELAGRFSFLLSIPAILGALILALDGDMFQSTVPVGVILLGSGAAAVVGYMALKVLLRMVQSGHLFRFAPYCWLVGAMALAFSIF